MGKRAIVSNETCTRVVNLYKAGTGLKRIAVLVHHGEYVLKSILKEQGVPLRINGTGTTRYAVSNPENKICSHCYIEKPKTEFSQQRNRSGNLVYRADCRQCSSERARLRTMLHKFGMSRAEYTKLLEKQGGVCACCGKPEWYIGRNGKIINLSIDHNHQTNQVRQLLCCRCNRVLGLTEESVETLHMLIEYLTKHK